MGWGHTELTDLCRLAAEAEVGQLYLFHHDPDRSDAEMDQIEASAKKILRDLGAETQVLAAREGFSFLF